MNPFERLWKLEASVNTLILNGKRSPEEVLRFLQRFIDEPDLNSDPVYLKCISLGEEIILHPTDGAETIAKATDVFNAHIDPGFRNYDVSMKPTKLMKVSVHELIENGTFLRLFESLGKDLDRLCLTQGQIKQFCKEHSDWLRTSGYATFFLVRANDRYFVAHVYRCSNGSLGVHAQRFPHGHTWEAAYADRIVVPQLSA